MRAAQPIYLYGLAQAPTEALLPVLNDIAGATDGAPEAIELGETTVIVGMHDGSELLQTRRRMLAHARVLESAMKVATVLPMRFGVVADDRQALHRLLAAHAGEIARQFARLDGQIEVGLRVRVSREAALDALLEANPQLRAARDRLSGRGADAHFDRIDLGRRVAETLERRRTDAQHSLAGILGKACTDHVLRAPEDDTEILRAECLLPVGGDTALARQLEEAAAGLGFAAGEEPVVHIVGPAPPFHFVDLALDPASSHGGSEEAA